MKHVLLSVLLILLSCKEPQKENFGFYFWRSKFSLTKTEKELLQNSTSKSFYIRIFDIDKTEGNFNKIGAINIKKKLDISKNIVPVIFITNKTWFKITNSEINLVANTINNEINKFQKISCKRIFEIQIDSDWDSKTKNDYFRFLEILKKISKKQITCTLRLHQVKDKHEAGIPPVKKVYLMCYATSSPLEGLEKNSILDLPTLKNYLIRLEEYPIRMDIALPIYSWGIITNHLGKRKLINALTEENLKNKNFEKIENSTYRILNDGFYFGMYLNKNFTIKTENIPEKKLLEVQKFIQQKIKYSHCYIYYHLDSKFTNRYKIIFK